MRVRSASSPGAWCRRRCRTPRSKRISSNARTANGNIVWYNDAKDIVDFLLDHARDTAGWFPNGTTSTGRWNIVRTGNPPDAKVTVITQAAAAAAILDFAYTDIHK